MDPLSCDEYGAFTTVPSTLWASNQHVQDASASGPQYKAKGLKAEKLLLFLFY